MSNKVIEALTQLLPKDQVNEVASAVEEMLNDAKSELEKEFNQNLEEAYQSLTTELTEAKKATEEGYKEAYSIIQDLRNRLEVQRTEAEAALEEGYEEAYQMLVQEREKNSNLEVTLYEEYEKKLAEMREFMVDKIDEFMSYRSGELYEQARKEILNDPSMAEHRLTLDRVVETVANYLSHEDYSSVVNKRLEESNKTIEDLKGQVRILEARSIKMSMDNAKLTEAVRKGNEVITESKAVIAKDEKKERQEKAKNAQGRGLTRVNEEVVVEHHDKKLNESKTTETIAEATDEMKAMLKLAGLVNDDN